MNDKDIRLARMLLLTKKILEHAGELCIIILRRIKREKETPYNTTHSRLGLYEKTNRMENSLQ